MTKAKPALALAWREKVHEYELFNHNQINHNQNLKT
jgi:hypothetical protein